MINTPCGFDEKFMEVLKEHFSKKSPLQIYGVLLLDDLF